MRLKTRLGCTTLVIIFVLFGIFSSIVFSVDGWVSPDYTYDEFSKWFDDDLLGDLDLETSAFNNYADRGYYLKLGFDESIICDKIRIWAYQSKIGESNENSYARIYVYDEYSEELILRYLGHIAKEQWVTIEFGEEYLISYVSFRSDTMIFGYTNSVFEFQFWEIEPDAEPSSIEVTPAESENDISVNHTMTALVLDQYEEPMAGLNLTWEHSGVGLIVSQGNVTDENGEAIIIIASNFTGNATVTCSVDGYVLEDSASKKWTSDYSPSTFGILPVWFISLIGVLLAVMVYTRNGFIAIVSIIGLVICINWVRYIGLPNTAVYMTICALSCGIGFCIMLILRRENVV